ncbi:fumarate reductase (CoM/CoB) subunit TfrB [Methanospirillum stamsii]|nr:fumarate reductase (CoM/CoB) subunit TfrB [Methanospirillum stamsii]
MMNITVTISRFNPDTDEEPRMESWTVEMEEGARVLHVLDKIHTLDPTLAYRSSCHAGQCGSCAVRVNGEPALACTKEASDGMVIEPLNLPVIKDLMVDLVPGINAIPRFHSSECGTLPTLEDVSKIKPLRDCIECLSCVSVCPAMRVTDFLGPTSMRSQMRIALDPREPGNRIREAITQGLFTCTSCNRCWRVCPKNIETPGKAIEKLREIANREGLTLPRHQEVAELVRTTGRSVESGKHTFLDLVDEVIEPYGEVKREVGFFCGCMFNARLPERAMDMLEVMRHAGIRVIIPKTQVCCGSPLIRTGQTSFIDELKDKNIRAFQERGITTVMTMCAGCGATLKNDYDTPFEVKDVSEILSETGLPPLTKVPITATYHDPCHLKNGQQITREPREILVTAVDKFVEMPAYCCGSGGGVRSGMPDEAAALGELRRAEINKTGADVVVTICPFCEYHIQEHSDRPVKNLMTVLVEALGKKPTEL